MTEPTDDRAERQRAERRRAGNRAHRETGPPRRGDTTVHAPDTATTATTTTAGTAGTPAEAAYLAVLTTTDSRERAEGIAARVVEARAAACAQIDGPVTSVYQWQGRIETEEEWRVLIKTTAGRYADLEALVRSIHTYETPEIIATPITAGSDAYLAWLSAETA